MKRRRFIQIVASCVPVGILKGSVGIDGFSRSLHPFRWDGYTMGAQGNFQLYSDDQAKAMSVMEACHDEIRRLERIFSLYDEHSVLSRLNREGICFNPPIEFQEVLETVDCVHRNTKGFFDPTVQSVWKLRESAMGQKEAFPLESSSVAEERIGWHLVEHDSKVVRFGGNRKIGITLNGIAQGYITDRITEILRTGGFEHVLVQLGEPKCLGTHPSGRAWKVGIESPFGERQVSEVVELKPGNAIATSAAERIDWRIGTLHHHILNPFHSEHHPYHSSVSVMFPSATEADAYSTGLAAANTDLSDHLKSRVQGIQIYTQ